MDRILRFLLHQRALVLIAGPKYMPVAYRGTPLARFMPFDPASATCPDAGQTLKDGFAARPSSCAMSSVSVVSNSLLLRRWRAEK